MAMPNELHVTPDGLRVSFTQALDPGQAQTWRFSLRASDILWIKPTALQNIFLAARACS